MRTSHKVVVMYCLSSKANSFFSTSFKYTTFRAFCFKPPDPPQSKGNAIFPDIDIVEIRNQKAQMRNADKNAVFVVTGASRGIGLELVHSLLNKTNGHVVACCRKPESVTSFPVSSRLTLLGLNLEDKLKIASASNYISETFGRVDVLWNVAGILHGSRSQRPERSLSQIDDEWMKKSFQVNVVGPILLSKSLTPLMKTEVTKKESQAKSVIVNLSARVGSISDNQLGGWYSYRMSKAALNQATKTMSVELKRQGIWTIALHPGTTDTDLSKPFQKNVKPGRLFPVKFTANRLIDVVDSMQDVHSGGFYDWAGKALPF